MTRRRRGVKGRHRRGAGRRPPPRRANRTRARRLPSRPTGARSAILPGSPPRGGRRSPVSRTPRRAPPFPPRAGARADTSRSRRSVVRDAAGTPRRPCRKACSTGGPSVSPRPRGEPPRSPAPARTPPPGCVLHPPTPRRSSGAGADTIGRPIPRRGAPSLPPRRRRRARSPRRTRGATMRPARRPRCRAGTRRSSLPATDRESRPGSSTAIVPPLRSLQSKVRPSSQAPHPSRRARRRTTARAAGRSRPVTSGTPLRRIPAFSAAMLPSVFPSHSRWSYPTVVMTDTAGRHALVASHRPPIPVSMTAIRTPFRRNQSEAVHVIISNQVSGSPAGERRSATRKPSRSVRGEIILPSMRTRSSGAIRCGEVYRPMGPSGKRRRTSYANEAVDPLPLVPAT